VEQKVKIATGSFNLGLLLFLGISRKNEKVSRYSQLNGKRLAYTSNC